ncbi:MAG: DUF885 domain-containing protein [Thermoplasmata archaeon]|nr:DUF885 domain-containing protein [Thermoplasmata archaeon]
MGETSGSGSGRSNEFRAYLSQDWKQWITEYPELATSMGLPGLNDRWTDDSQAGIERRRRHLADSRSRLQRFDRATVATEDRLTYDMYRGLLDTADAGLRFGHDPLPFCFGSPRNLWMPLHQLEGIHILASDMAELQPRACSSDYGDLLVRLRTLPDAIEQNRVLLEKGLAGGYSPPRVAMVGVPDQITNLTPADPFASPLLKPFSDFPAAIGESERSRLRAEARTLFVDRVAPALGGLRGYLESTYVPACRESIARAALPNGAESYDFLVQWTTTTDLTPRQIHEIGTAEVQRIRASLEALMAKTGFKGSFAEFKRFLREDPRFSWTSAEDLVDGYRIIAKKIDPTLGRLFGRLPRLPYGVVPVPQFREATSPTAYYQSGAPATGRAGNFFVNTFQVGIRPRWEMEALTLHESVPGHHLQIAVAQELEHLPEFRKETGPTAFAEGWGLYAESLGEELGFYQDPYSKIGQLTFDMWRSIRLVVDTGMHALGWSRDRAIEFFRENTGMSDVGIQVEVDRYIVWPAQALAYKIGQLKIRELRTYAEGRLGGRFDVRGFHDVVLGEGALPLRDLETRVKAWVEARAAA